MISKLARIPKRIKQDLQIIRLVKNWAEILTAKYNHNQINHIELRNGFIMNAPPEVDLIFLFHEIWLDKVYSPEGYKLDQDRVIFDIGANIGIFALFASANSLDGKVYSFEPFTKNAEYFEKNVRESKLDNVKLFKKAISRDNSERVLEINDSWIKHTLVENQLNSNGTKVDCISLDEALSDIDKCDFMKIDCEGSEYEILYYSSPETIKKIRKIVGEYHNKDSENMNGEALCKFLKQNNFQIDIFEKFDETSGLICAKNMA